MESWRNDPGISTNRSSNDTTEEVLIYHRRKKIIQQFGEGTHQVSRDSEKSVSQTSQTGIGHVIEQKTFELYQLQLRLEDWILPRNQ